MKSSRRSADGKLRECFGWLCQPDRRDEDRWMRDQGKSMRRNSAILLLAILALIATGHEATTAPAPAIRYTMRTVERRDPQCPRGPAGCPVYISFRYPVIERAPSAAAARAITQAIDDFLLTGVGESRKFSSIAVEMDEFMRAYEQARKLSPGIGYSEDRVVSVLYNANGIFSLNFDLAYFYATAHPNYARTFANLDVRTGRRITLDDVLVAGYRPRLNRIAEERFRASKGLKPADSLKQAGYEFPNDTFMLNDNFSIGPTGITFFYNPYEIASYADGPTELLLTYRQIRDLLRPDGLLGPMRE